MATVHDVSTSQAPTDLSVLSNSHSHTLATCPPSVSADHGLEKRSSASSSSPCPSDEEIEVEYPEGGREAWTVVFGSCISMIASFGVMNTIGTLYAHLSEHQLARHSEGEIGWIFGMYSFLSFFGGIQVGGYLSVTPTDGWEAGVDGYNNQGRYSMCSDQGHCWSWERCAWWWD